MGLNKQRLDVAARSAKWVWNNTERITKWIEVAALVVAAFWAYTRFLTGEKPSLETRVKMTVNLNGERPGPTADSCYVYFTVQLANQGVVSFNVHNIHVRAWHSKIAIPVKEDVQAIDLQKLQLSEMILDSKEQLNMDFSPGESTSQTYSWVIRVHPGIYLFRADLDAVNRKGARKDISASAWSQNLCTN